MAGLSEDQLCHAFADQIKDSPLFVAWLLGHTKKFAMHGSEDVKVLWQEQKENELPRRLHGGDIGSGGPVAVAMDALGEEKRTFLSFLNWSDQKSDLLFISKTKGLRENSKWDRRQLIRCGPSVGPITNGI
jgi:hypothetical protein